MPKPQDPTARSSSSSTDPPVFAVKSSKLESSRSLRVEGRILNQLRGCPYIVHYFGDGTSLEHEEVVYNLLLEYAPGGSRESLIKSRAGNIMEFEVSFYAYQLLTGIQEVRGWGFVHCDLKPANVLVFPCGTAGSYGTVFLGRLSSSSSTDPPVFAVKSSKLEFSRSLRVEGRLSSSSSTDLPVFAVKYSKLESSRSFRVEGRILNQLRGCPYIVHCFGDGTSLEHEEVVYNLLLEYAPGGSRESLVKSRAGNIMEFEVSFYAYQLLTGIQEVHGWGFVHCDLKPTNVLVFPCGCGVNRLKIADFGLVKPSGVNIFGGFHRGSLLYTLLESLVSEMHEAPKDIWSIGCIVVEMITGNPAWRFNDSKDASLNIVFKKPEIPEGISNRCKDFLEWCFESNPSTRLTAVMLLNHPFVANEFNLLLGKKLEDHHQVNSPFGFEGWSSTTCLF
nr:mitogen-activated protein kinase kinase kinase ANP1-like [Ipomoea batatas]